MSEREGEGEGGGRGGDTIRAAREGAHPRVFVRCRKCPEGAHVHACAHHGCPRAYLRRWRVPVRQSRRYIRQTQPDKIVKAIYKTVTRLRAVPRVRRGSARAPLRLPRLPARVSHSTARTCVRQSNKTVAYKTVKAIYKTVKARYKTVNARYPRVFMRCRECAERAHVHACAYRARPRAHLRRWRVPATRRGAQPSCLGSAI